MTEHTPRLFDQIQAGDRVTILTPQNQHCTGRAVMKHRTLGFWVLNTGGRDGTTALASPSNVINVRSK
jgi:hypothetical protein